MVQELQDMDDVVFTLDEADDDVLNWLTAWSVMIRDSAGEDKNLLNAQFHAA